ncbi:hypothetical protein BGX26_006495 [Mortierella sp. AD094]|nr:hypothetical protein BGX26_006495 [Mortierella sp. AD094]
MAAEALPTIGERLQAMTITQKVALAIFCVIVIAFVVVFFAYEKQVFEHSPRARRRLCPKVRCWNGGAWSNNGGDMHLPALRLYRFAFNNYISRKFGDNIEFREMSKAVSKDVLNAYFGAMTQLPYWKFILATTLSTPRLFLPIFIGHNISSLADPTVTGKDRVIKWAANIAGIIIALAVGWYIYRHTTRRIERINAGLAAEEDEEVGGTVRHTRAAQYDAVINMEEMERAQGPASSPTYSTATTIAMNDGRNYKSEAF